jgi:outer membrane lipoprotein LolB
MAGLSRRAAARMLGAFAVALLAGCATPTPPGVQTVSRASEAWTGRLSLNVESEPAQSYSALFDLRGNPQAGELRLTSPIGSTLAQLRWAPGEAILDKGGESRRFESVEALIEAATGAAIPVGALFAWLAGRDEPVAGWRANLSQVSTGRLQATRESPRPRADLRIVFEPA